MFVGQPGWEWPLKETYPHARTMAIDLRRLGFEVNGRGTDNTWHPSERDRLELRSFAEAFARAFPRHTPPPDYSGLLTANNLRALDHASSNRSRFLLNSREPPSCCTECHFDTEDREILPYLRAVGMDVEAKAIALEHLDLRGEGLDVLRKHAAEEMETYRNANVPQRWLTWLDAEHRQIERGEMTWKKH